MLFVGPFPKILMLSAAVATFGATVLSPWPNWALISATMGWGCAAVYCWSATSLIEELVSLGIITVNDDE